ncbi:hypothetical protein BHE74_00001791 [Ensete ventricosum]|nr:hypothetical protein GW17_00002736 [Ensete ventricosum]RWW89273.1 hypothetical protein BHE74_00001791 [Ensete ventricosum]
MYSGNYGKNCIYSLSHKQNPRIKLGFPETLFVPSDRFLADLSRPDRDWDLARDRAVNRGRSSKTIPFPGSSEEVLVLYLGGKSFGSKVGFLSVYRSRIWSGIGGCCSSIDLPLCSTRLGM